MENSSSRLSVNEQYRTSVSQEEISVGLRLASSGMPVTGVLRMMSVSPKMFFGWMSDYMKVFRELLTGQAFASNEDAEPCLVMLSNTLRIPTQRIKEELGRCRLRYSKCEAPAICIRQLLASRQRVAVFFHPFAQIAIPDSSLEDCAVLLSLNIVGTPGDIHFNGVCCATVIGARWVPVVGSTEAVIEAIPMEVRLEGIFGDPIDAVRTFYTSPSDALILGDFLLRKTHEAVG
jgi:hypothetical protein